MAQKTGRFRRVCVLTGDHQLPDATKPGAQYSETDLRYHTAMREALQSLPDYEFDFLNDHNQLMPRMLDDPPEFVLNLCDTGFRNIATQEWHIPSFLEMLNIPYSGAPPACMAICYDKAIVRMVADSLGVPTPSEHFIGAEDLLDELSQLSFPALIKPNQADGSVGITRDAVVHDAAQARHYIEELRRLLPGRAALVQEYLSGAEYGVALIGNPGTGFTALPPLTVDYSGLPKGLAPILAYESKTEPDSPYWTQISFKRAELDEQTVEQLVNWGKQLFARLQCRDYARFDFRTATDGTIKLMEVNPNPAWDNEAKLALMAGFAGKRYPEMLAMILDAAQQRLVASSK